MAWIDVERGRGERDRMADGGVPEALPLLDANQRELLRRWVRSDSGKRGRAALLNDAGPSAIELAESLCELLLREGWIVRRERLSGGAWRWDSISWRDLPRLQDLLGVASPRSRAVERQACIEKATAWLQARRAATATSALDPDLLDELSDAVEQLQEDKSMRVEMLAARLELLQAVASWHDSAAQGSRRDFALRARGTTKALSESEWRWLESSFDLERLRIARFAPVAWLAGDIVLQWGERRADIGALHCLGVPLSDLQRATGATAPSQWWLIENRASFERQAQSRNPGVLLVWMPGRPSTAWMEAVAHVLRLAPAPAWISADADPAGVDIACTVGALWDSKALGWQPHQMGVGQLEGTAQHWPLNDHDRRLIATLMDRSDLRPELRALCEAMLREGRKAEQEGWM